MNHSLDNNNNGWTGAVTAESDQTAKSDQKAKSETSINSKHLPFKPALEIESIIQYKLGNFTIDDGIETVRKLGKRDYHLVLVKTGDASPASPFLAGIKTVTYDSLPLFCCTMSVPDGLTSHMVTLLRGQNISTGGFMCSLEQSGACVAHYAQKEATKQGISLDDIYNEVHKTKRDIYVKSIVNQMKVDKFSTSDAAVMSVLYFPVLRSDVVDLKQKVFDMQQQLQQQQNDAARRDLEKDKRIKELESRLELRMVVPGGEAVSMIDELQKTIDDRNSEILDCKKETDSLKNRVVELNSRVAELEEPQEVPQQPDYIDKKIKELELKIHCLYEDLRMEKNDHDETREEKDGFRRKLSQAIDQYEAELSRYEEKLDKLKADSEAAVLYRIICSLRQRVDELQRKLQLGGIHISSSQTPVRPIPNGSADTTGSPTGYDRIWRGTHYYVRTGLKCPDTV